MSERNSSSKATGRAARAHQHAVHNAEQMRIRLAREAARVLAEGGTRDFATAKRKAAERLASPDTRHLPSNEEIEEELRRYLELFQGAKLPDRLAHLRGLALEAMRFLQAFEPRLVGSVLAGTATEYAVVELHVSADTPEQIALWLTENAIPYEQSERRLRFGGDRYETLPTYRFTVNETPIELCVLSRRGAREAPLSPVDGRPMKRANVREVETLVALADGA
ncbi:MAG TPA: hypothetical protein VJS66_05010 [Burkholderiales bacterium]|nr:hypothetical protein [Burkholderiales bacterium]